MKKSQPWLDYVNLHHCDIVRLLDYLEIKNNPHITSTIYWNPDKDEENPHHCAEDDFDEYDDEFDKILQQEYEENKEFFDELAEKYG
eukprot:gene9805-2130_t